MRCPSCQTDLKKEKLQDVEIDRCPTCYGLWLDHGELNRLVDKQDQMVEFASIDHDPGIHGDNHPKRKCPQCQKVMQKVDLLEGDSGIIYDYCSSCQGFWLDQGEISRTKRYIKEHGSEVTREKRLSSAMWAAIAMPPKPF